MAKSYRASLDVRGYEIDGYGHVNHAVYINYMEYARWKMLEEESIGLKNFTEWKRWPIISAIEMKYLKPCYLGDKLEVRSKVIEHSRARLIIEQEIYRADAPVAKGTVQVVIVNEKGRPADLPTEIARLWTHQTDAGSGI